MRLFRVKSAADQRCHRGWSELLWQPAVLFTSASLRGCKASKSRSDARRSSQPTQRWSFCLGLCHRHGGQLFAAWVVGVARNSSVKEHAHRHGSLGILGHRGHPRGRVARLFGVGGRLLLLCPKSSLGMTGMA